VLQCLQVRGANAVGCLVLLWADVRSYSGVILGPLWA
jgi:hypothetical protein